MKMNALKTNLLAALALVTVVTFAWATSGDYEAPQEGFSAEPPAEIHAMVAIEDLIIEVRQLSHEEKVRKVNQVVNLIPYVTDETMWGVEDRWSMPEEFLRIGAGDSEEFAITKFYALWAAGFPVDKMMLAVSKHPLIDEEHVVLLVELPGTTQPLVLDSLTYDLQLIDDRPELLVVRTLDSVHLVSRLEWSRDVMLSAVLDWRMSTGQDVIASFTL